MTPLSVILLLPLLKTASPTNTIPQPPSCALIDCLPNHTCNIDRNNTPTCVPISSPGIPTPIPQGKVCGSNLCPPNESCCNPSCGICTPPGKGCVKLLCGPGVTYVPAPEPEPETKTAVRSATPTKQIQPPRPTPTSDTGIECGPNICTSDQICCNSSCGYCKMPGEGCTKELCAPPQSRPQCGPTTCNVGEYCCNASCGYCREQGEGCTEEFCVSGPKCGRTTCKIGERCCDPYCGTCVSEGSGCGLGC